jgi:amine acid ABC transporter, permease protein, 3-TM region, His/Glu/Gln/Arg/opine family
MKKPTRKEWIVRLVMIGAALLSLLILFLVNRDAVSSALAKNFSSNNANLLLQGLANTFLITLVAFIMGLILGTLVCLITQSESQNVVVLAFKQIAKFYVLLFRGTPVVVQLLIIYFILFASYSGDSVYVAMLAFGLNSGAYVSEIIRGGINAVPLGQYQAGLSLGLSYRSMMQKIILPQAYKNAFPSLCNEVIALIKETSVAGFIGTLDLTLAFRKIANATYDFLTVYLVMGLVYFVIVMLLSAGLSFLERKAFSHA